MMIMKAYGFSRDDKQECKYGCCCVTKGNRHCNKKNVLRQRARKTARREGKVEASAWG
jgi:hypothetical protein